MLASSLAAAQPDIVFFISDDHGYLDSGPYGSQVVRTPNLDRLAADGAVFRNVFVGSPSCAPSRAILLSGLMSSRNGVQANHTPIRDGLRLLPDLMEQAGYEVAMFGKVAHGRGDKRLEPYYHEATVRHGPLDVDLLPEKVVEFLAERESRKPLLLLVGTHSPHVYWPENDGYDAAEVELPPTFHDTLETRRYRTRYYTDVSLMDERLGVVREGVRRHLGDDALFLYTSDHGAQWPFGKWNLYDSGIRVPFIAAWPGKLPPGSRRDALISFVDLLPTFLDLAGARPVDAVDGLSFGDVLRGWSDQHRQAIFATHSGDGRMNVYPMRTIRTERYKLILNLYPEFRYTTHIDKGKNLDGLEFWESWERDAATDAHAAKVVAAYHERAPVELYDLDNDPHEQRNLAADFAHAGIQSELMERLAQWLAVQDDPKKPFAEPRLLANPEEPAQGRQ